MFVRHVADKPTNFSNSIFSPNPYLKRIIFTDSFIFIIIMGLNKLPRTQVYICKRRKAPTFILLLLLFFSMVMDLGTGLLNPRFNTIISMIVLIIMKNDTNNFSGLDTDYPNPKLAPKKLFSNQCIFFLPIV